MEHCMANWRWLPIHPVSSSSRTINAEAGPARSVLALTSSTQVFPPASLDLVAAHEENYPDVYNNVPLLAKRLIDFLGADQTPGTNGRACRATLSGFAANATSPVVVRSSFIARSRYRRHRLPQLD